MPHINDTVRNLIDMEYGGVVEIETDSTNKLWINVDCVCRLRIGKIDSLVLKPYGRSEQLLIFDDFSMPNLGPRDYQHIAAYGEYCGWSPFTIRVMQNKAHREKAPTDSLYFDIVSNRWIQFEAMTTKRVRDFITFWFTSNKS